MGDISYTFNEWPVNVFLIARNEIQIINKLLTDYEIQLKLQRNFFEFQENINFNYIKY